MLCAGECEMYVLSCLFAADAHDGACGCVPTLAQADWIRDTWRSLTYQYVRVTTINW
jgi:hypothetical protein